MSRPEGGTHSSDVTPPLSPPSLAVVVPVHDEQDNVAPLLD